MHSPSSVSASLLESFWAYDDALLSNDLESMGRLFAPGPETLRGDGRRLLVGHEAIATFRARRQTLPTRQVTALHVRPIDPDGALVMAETAERADDGTLAHGLQTQLWQRAHSGQWRIAAAHVTLPDTSLPSPLLGSRCAGPDASVWRERGDPLLAPTSSGSGGALRGRSIAVKDVFRLKGFAVGAGVPQWLAEQDPSTSTAEAVDDLLAAGAHVAGIAQTDEFAYSIAGRNSHYGPAFNPAAPHAATGGSSSGPASAVAQQQADIGLGTDTAGSIRVPASYLGLVGLRSTHGSVSVEGMLPLAPDFDVVGWVTADVRGALEVGEILLPDDVEPARGAARTVLIPALQRQAQPPVADAVGAVVRALSKQQVLPPIEEVEIPAATLDAWFEAFTTLQGWQAWQSFGAWIDGHPDALGPDVASRFAAAAAISAERADQARATVLEASYALREILTGSVLALPSTPTPAPPLSAAAAQVDRVRRATLRLTFLASIAGLPAVSLPVARVAEPWSSDTAPVGLCLVTPPGTDRALLRTAAAVERALGPAHASPGCRGQLS